MSERLTDAALADIATDVDRGGRGGIACDRVAPLVAEVRRLRSDSWLERAVEEIPHSYPPEQILAILKRHRDQA